jgi:hypothetical protein
VPDRRLVRGSALGGSWTCRDVGGGDIGCGIGPFRVAVWRPLSRLASGDYMVAVNPEHVLDVTDMHGNPFEGANVLNDTFFRVDGG